ncbi:MAG: multicopper oxidase [Hyperionvirus sp.]|uniref:Multicopper oxidase n=1 Tax=Hyperionvirus sp. TaxID=2487770 RepID=A0A3G5ABC6_9VIRU|nr:MAG: multicopper oxidase [Hyperionvirus sp.]
MPNKSVQLVQPPLLDFSTLQKNDDVKIIICNTQHKFASDSEFSGTDVTKQPIFGSQVFINGKEFSNLSYGLPFMRFPQGSTPKITYENKTRFTFNIHYHGLNTVGAVDGTAMEVVFGHNTLLGPTVTFQFPKIMNNQALLWFHSHNMFVSMELIYGGIVGLLQIVDKTTEWLTERFQYGDNQILLTALDMDLTSEGTQTFANLIADENRSNFAIINGTSAVNWYTSEPSVPFVNDLFHTTTKNLVKIDILNASLNWRVFHIGVCDEKKQIKPFYLVQTDTGLMNPTQLKMTFIPVAGRVGIIIDLNDFKDKVAHLFFYNYDLTEILSSTTTFPDQPNNPTLTATIPDLKKSRNPTSYPTPIPDPKEQNQQQDYTNLDYPKVDLIDQTEQILNNGTINVPKRNRIKPFLKIIFKEKYQNQLSLADTISRIRKTIFGDETYDEWKFLLKQPCFEYDPKFNYLSFLNKDYYYNLPKLDIDAPLRNLFMFPESNTNAVAGGNKNGTTEYVNSANRIMADLWNSAQLNLGFALEQYKSAPNKYKPPNVPTSKFTIYKTNDKYSNTAMISNDTLKIEIYEEEIRYGDFCQKPLATKTVIFPPSTLLNLQEWIDLINETFKQTTITIGSSTKYLNTILECDWAFFPYALDFLYEKTVYVKSAVIKTMNSSCYWIRLLGRWPLLQFFGKPMTGNTLDTSNDLMSQLRKKQQRRRAKTIVPKNDRLPAIKNHTLYIKCDEVGTFGTFDSEIQQIFPFYATAEGDVQLPIACMKRDAELIIPRKKTYIGLYDGYLNDNLNSFSVRLHSTEVWLYTNGDDTDAHPLHFHMTSGFAAPQSTYNSPGLVSCKRLYDPLIYARDIYQIGPQETVSFRLTWPHYSSYDKTKSPAFKGIGGVIHCHFLQHNDANSMIIQYFIDTPFSNSESDKQKEECY